MKVLLCTPYDLSAKNPGGISVWAKNIVDYHKDHPDEGITLDVFQTSRTHNVNENTKKINRLLYGIKDYLFFINGIVREVKEYNYDVVHVTTTASLGSIKDIVLCRKLKKRGVKVFLHYHFGRIPSLITANNWEWKLVKRSIKLSYKTIVMDHRSYESLKSIHINNVVEVPNPYSPELEKQMNEFEGEVQRVPHRILYAGRVFRKKGVYELVKACAQISNIELRLVGPCEEVDKNNLLDIANHGDWIHFVGPVPHERVMEELLAADIFVMPTYNEGFPNAVLECMISKTPIIVTPVGAIPEMLDFGHNPCGLEIRPYIVEDIVLAIQKLIDDNTQKKAMTALAYHRVRERYSLTTVGKMLFDVWKS